MNLPLYRNCTRTALTNVHCSNRVSNNLPGIQQQRESASGPRLLFILRNQVYPVPTKRNLAVVTARKEGGTHQVFCTGLNSRIVFDFCPQEHDSQIHVLFRLSLID